MKIRMFADINFPVDIRRMVDGLTKTIPSITWRFGSTPFAARDRTISNPDTYEKLSPSLRREIDEDDLALLFTEKPYDNNYFFDSPDEKP